MVDLSQALVFYAVFLFSTTLHEAAHAWAAMRLGDLTAYHGGQVSLDPMPHIRREPFGMVVLPLLSVLLTGFPLGFASAPFDPEWAMRRPRHAALMALAGPASNLLLVLVAALLLRLGVTLGALYAPETIRFGEIAAAHDGGWWSAAALVLGVLFSLNLLLAAFNLLPFPPLDGSGAMPLLLSDGATRAYQQFVWRTPGVAIIGLLVAWKLFDIIFDPLWLGAVNLLYPGASYH